MKLKSLMKSLFDYRTYLLIGIILIVLAPASEVFHWNYRSTTFAKWAFILFCLASVVVFIDIFLTTHPELKKKLRKIKFDNKLWKF